MWRHGQSHIEQNKNEMADKDQGQNIKQKFPIDPGENEEIQVPDNFGVEKMSEAGQHERKASDARSQLKWVNMSQGEAEKNGIGLGLENNKDRREKATGESGQTEEEWKNSQQGNVDFHDNDAIEVRNEGRDLYNQSNQKDRQADIAENKLDQEGNLVKDDKDPEEAELGSAGKRKKDDGKKTEDDKKTEDGKKTDDGKKTEDDKELSKKKDQDGNKKSEDMGELPEDKKGKDEFGTKPTGDREYQPPAGKLGKLKDGAGKTADVAGKGMQAGGKGLEFAGKGTDIAGKGLQAAGKGMSAIPVVGSLAGAALMGAGKGVSSVGKGMKGVGGALNKAGKKVAASKGKGKDKDKNKDPRGTLSAQDLPKTKKAGLPVEGHKDRQDKGSEKDGPQKDGATKGEMPGADDKKPKAKRLGKIGGAGSQAQRVGYYAKKALDKSGIPGSDSKYAQEAIDMLIIAANILFLICELFAAASVIAIGVFVINVVLFFWYLIKNHKRLAPAIIHLALLAFLLGVFQVMIVLIPLAIIFGMPDFSGGARFHVKNIAAPFSASASQAGGAGGIYSAEVQAAQNAYEMAVASGKDRETSIIDALSITSGNPDMQVAETIVAITQAESTAGSSITSVEQERIIQQVLGVAASAGLAVDGQQVRSILSQQQMAARRQLTLSPGNVVVDFSNSNIQIQPQGNLNGFNISQDSRDRRTIEIGDGAQIIYYLNAPAAGTAMVSLLYSTEKLLQPQEIGSIEIDDQQYRLVATAQTEKNLFHERFNLRKGDNKIIISSDQETQLIVIESIVMEPITESAQDALTETVLSNGVLQTTVIPFDVTANPDVSELALRAQDSQMKDKFFILTDATNIPSASSDYELQFRWADSGEWQAWNDLSKYTRHFPITFSVQRAYTFYGNLFLPDDAIYFLAVYGREGGHERCAYFRVKATPPRGTIKLSNEVEFLVVPK